MVASESEATSLIRRTAIVISLVGRTLPRTLTLSRVSFLGQPPLLGPCRGSRLFPGWISVPGVLQQPLEPVEGLAEVLLALAMTPARNQDLPRTGESPRELLEHARLRGRVDRRCRTQRQPQGDPCLGLVHVLSARPRRPARLDLNLRDGNDDPSSDREEGVFCAHGISGSANASLLQDSVCAVDPVE